MKAAVEQSALCIWQEMTRWIDRVDQNLDSQASFIGLPAPVLNKKATFECYQRLPFSALSRIHGVQLSSSQLPITVAYCEAGSAIVTEGRYGKAGRCAVGELMDCPADIIVLESPLFETLADCRRVYEELTSRVLLVVQREELVDVLGWLRENDDVCLTDTPSALIAHRIQRLVDFHDGQIDPLTGLLSRDHFAKVVQRHLQHASRQRPMSLILADLDHFKAINDRHGHAAGDEVLRQCGKMLATFWGDGQVPARHGGEQFAVFVHGNGERAYQLAEEFRRKISAWPFDENLSVTVSLGVTTVEEPVDVASLFGLADEALYAAKAQGRNRTIRYADVESASFETGEDVEVAGLENRAQVLTERVARFITMRSKRILQNICAEAKTDALTRFYTRRYLERRLKNEFEQSGSRHQELTIALVDIDHFGRINKSHGWPTGDKVLQQVCDIIRCHVRATDWIGRYGGEEFCIVMPDTDLREACVVLERIRQAVADAQFTSTCDEPVPVTLSAGVVTCHEQDPNHQALLERASRQTLAAKRAGRNRIHCGGTDTASTTAGLQKPCRG